MSFSKEEKKILKYAIKIEKALRVKKLNEEDILESIISSTSNRFKQLCYLEERIALLKESQLKIKEIAYWKQDHKNSSGSSFLKILEKKEQTNNVLFNVDVARTISYIKSYTDFLANKFFNYKEPIEKPVNKKLIEFIFDELCFLKKEKGDNFIIGGSQREKENSISIITDPIILKDKNDNEYNFGRFEIKYYFYEGIDRKNRYRITALEPLGHRCDCDLVHPHIANRYLCEGEAVDSINDSIKEGRLIDFFDIVANVLNTYNSKSPYKRLETWLDGTECYECGETVEEDDAYHCSNCSDIYFCEGCIRFCNSCEESVCPECSTYCEGCDNTVCNSCMKSCSSCGRERCSSCMNTCSECHSSVCSRCETTCSNCNDSICKDCRRICNDCGEELCSSCSYTCGVCNDVFCTDCCTECESCNDFICKKCETTCEKCDKVFCEDHLKECSSCGRSLCEDCISDCNCKINEERC